MHRGWKARDDALYERMAWMTAHFLKPFDTEGIVTPALLLGKPSGDPAALESLSGLTPPDGYETVMKKQADRKADG